MSHRAVHNFSRISGFFDRCRSGRADIAIIVDSNGRSAGDSGHSQSYDRAWGNRLGMYGTGVLPGNAQGGWGAGFGTYVGGGAAALINTAPSPYDGLFPNSVDADHLASGWAVGYGYLGSGALAQNDTATILDILGDDSTNTDGSRGCPINKANATLRWHFTYGTFAAGAGRFYPAARFGLDELAYNSTGIATNTGVAGLADGSLDVLAAPPGVFGAYTRNAHTVRFCPWFFDNTTQPKKLTAPFYLAWQRAEDPDQLTGVAVTTMLYQGGQGTWDAVKALRVATTQSKTEWLRQLVRLQNDAPMALFQILQGQNDTNQAFASLGPNPALSNTIAGCLDNHVALIAEIRAAWTTAGYDLANLFFLLGPYHPQEESRAAWTRELDVAFADYSDGEANVAVARRYRAISTSAYYRSRTDVGATYGLYADVSDAHLASKLAYEVADEIAVNAILPPVTITERHASGDKLDLKLFNEAGEVYDAVTGGWGKIVAAKAANYFIAGVEQGTTGYFNFTLPVALERAGRFRAEITVRTGASFALADANVRWVEAVEWDGVRQASLNTVDADVEAVDDDVADVRAALDGGVPLADGAITQATLGAVVVPANVTQSNGLAAVDDTLMVSTAAGGSTATVVACSQAFASINANRYVGNVLVHNKVGRTITAYADPGSGASRFTVSPAFPAAPQAGEGLKVVFARTAMAAPVSQSLSFTSQEVDVG